MQKTKPWILYLTGSPISVDQSLSSMGFDIGDRGQASRMTEDGVSGVIDMRGHNRRMILDY